MTAGEVTGTVTIGVDVGGTFTDVVLYDASVGALTTLKVPSTPDHPDVAVLEGVRQGLAMAGVGGAAVGSFLHGTTITTNTLIQLRGARCALILTAGLRGIAQVQSQMVVGPPRATRRERATPLVEHAHHFEVTERIGSRGEIVTPLDESEVKEIAARLRAERIEAVAVSLLFSFTNSVHEQRVREILAVEVPECRVVCASDILPRIREWPRTSTAILSAYLDPCLVSYIADLASGLGRSGISTKKTYLMTSNGGVVPFSAVDLGGRSVNTLLSGPAAAVQAAKRVAEAAGSADVVMMDLGGTSCDVAFIKDAQALEVTAGTVCGYDAHVPMLDIVTVGAGGGTVATVTSSGSLQVGPRSAGANPGPSAYGLGGTDATVTDADVVLGYLNPDYFLGGRLTLDAARARTAVTAHIAVPLKMSTEEAALSVIRINDAHMADAIRVVAAKAAIDLRACRLLGCGGAGPVHAAAVAEELGIDEVIIPESPGVFAALGLLCTDVIQDYVRTVITRMDELHADEIVTQFAALSERAVADYALQGVPAAMVQHRYEVDARYAGQGFEIRIAVPAIDDGHLAASMAAAFHARHQEIYGHAIPTDPVDIVSFRLRAVVERPQYHPSPTIDAGADSTGVTPRTRTLHFASGVVVAQVMMRPDLRIDEEVLGPLVIEQPDTTVIVPPGWTARRDGVGTLLLTRQLH